MKAVFNNLKLAVFIYLLVLLFCTILLLYVPQGLNSQVDMLQKLVQSKQLVVNTLRNHPQKKEFVIPKEASQWLQQLPPDPEVDRALIQLNDLFQQTGVQFESISIADNTKNQNELQQLLNEATGKTAQNQTQKQQSNAHNSNQGNQKGSNDKSSQTVNTITFNLTLSGKYESVMDFLYQLVHASRLFHVESLQLTHQADTATTASLPSPVQQNSAQQQVPNQANKQNQTQAQQQQAQTTGTSNQQSSQSQAIVNPFLQALLANGIANPNLGQAAASNSILPNAQPILPVANPPVDKISVAMTLSAYYMPDASFLGSLPKIQLYPPEKRNNPFVP